MIDPLVGVDRAEVGCFVAAAVADWHGHGHGEDTVDFVDCTAAAAAVDGGIAAATAGGSYYSCHHKDPVHTPAAVGWVGTATDIPAD